MKRGWSNIEFTKNENVVKVSRVCCSPLIINLIETVSEAVIKLNIFSIDMGHRYDYNVWTFLSQRCSSNEGN